MFHPLVCAPPPCPPRPRCHGIRVLHEDRIPKSMLPGVVSRMTGANPHHSSRRLLAVDWIQDVICAWLVNYYISKIINWRLSKPRQSFPHLSFLISRTPSLEGTSKGTTPYRTLVFSRVNLHQEGQKAAWQPPLDF